MLAFLVNRGQIFSHISMVIKLHKIFVLILLLNSFVIHSVDATVRILTFHCNLPHLLEMQCKSLNKFILDDFELIVLNDASNPEVKLEIESICSKYGALCIRFEPEWHDFNYYLNDYFRKIIESFPNLMPHHKSPSLRHSRMIQYALENFGYHHDDIVVILDGDAFPIRSVNFKLLLTNYDIVGSMRKGEMCDFFYPVFVAFYPRKLRNPKEFNLNWDYINEYVQDTGAASYRYMQSHPEIEILKIPFIRGDTLSKWNENEYIKYNLDSRSIHLINKLRGYYYETHMDFHILHYKGSSHREMRPERDRLINEFLNDCLNSDFIPLRNISAYDLPIQFPGDDK